MRWLNSCPVHYKVFRTVFGIDVHTDAEICCIRYGINPLTFYCTYLVPNLQCNLIIYLPGLVKAMTSKSCCEAAAVLIDINRKLQYNSKRERSDIMVDISICVDDVVKKQAEAVCEELGLSLSVATNIFYKKLVSYGGIPFELRVDPFYSEENQKHLEKVINNYYDGKSQLVHKEIAALEEMEE